MYELTALTELRTGREFVVETEPNFKAIFPATSSSDSVELLVRDKLEAGALTDLLRYLRQLGRTEDTIVNTSKCDA